MPPTHPTPHPRIAIAGFGLITPLAHSAWETFSALLAGRTIADRASRLPDDVAWVDLVRALGCVSVAQHTSVDPSIELAERAAREAMMMAGITSPGELEGIAGISKGAVALLEPSPPGRGQGEGTSSHPGATSRDNLAAESSSRERTTQQNLDAPSPHPLPRGEGVSALALGPAGYLASQVRDRLGIANLTTTIAACASSLTALHHARLRLLHERDTNRILVVTSEAALLPMFIHSYRRLGVLPPLTPAGYRGRPLDVNRNGFMLAELGAAVVLERVADGAELKPGQIELIDSAIAAEGFDMIRPAPGMPALEHVATKLMRGRAIDMIHPHATGTQDHDEAELAVYARVLGGATPPPQLYASKGALGHGLGAAGLVSLVLACLSARTNRALPMPWLSSPVDSSFFNSKPQTPNPKLATHAIFAAGFGGHVAGAVIVK